MSTKIYNVVVATHDPLCPLIGGGALRTLLVARALNDMNNNVCLVAPADKRRELDGLETISISAPRKQRSQILSALKFNMRFLLRVFSRLSKTDIFVSHNTIACLFVPFLKRIFGFKFVLDITDVHAEYLVIGRRNIFERMAKPFLLWYEYWIIRSADKVVVATRRMRKLLLSRKVDNSKIEIVYDGAVGRTWSRDKKNDSAKTIIHLGAVDRQHGLDILMRAMVEIVKECADVRLLVVGGGREFESVKKLACSLGIEKNCEFTGSVSMQDASGYLARAGIGIIARPDTLANNIITTLKIFDYWASGTAVVAPALDGIKEIADNGRDVLFFEPGNSGDMACRILELIKDSQLKNSLVASGVIKLQDFDFEKACSRIAQMIVQPGTEG